MFQTPARLIQPPRFVDDATSGLTVTTCLATLGCGAREVDEEAPERLLRRGRARVRPPDVGRDGRAARLTGSGRAAAARPRRRAELGLGRAGRERRPRVAGVGAELAARAAPTARSVSSAEWLAGCPWVGSPQALIV